MKKVDFFSGQVVTEGDLDYLESTKISAISQRYDDIFTDGIFRKSTVGVTNEFEIIPNGENFDVGPGTAKITLSTGTSERIELLSSDIKVYTANDPDQTPPRRTGRINIPLDSSTDPGDDNFVWIEYVETATDDISLHWETGAINYPRKKDGYRIVVNTNANYDNTTDAVFIAKITRPPSGNNLDASYISYSGRIGGYVTFRSQFQDTVTGPVQYQRDSHSNGIISSEEAVALTREEIHLSHAANYDESSPESEILVASTDTDSAFVAQSFTPESNIDITGVQMRIRVVGESTFTSGEIRAYLYNNDDSGANDIPGTTVLATGDTNTETITDNFHWIHFNIPETSILTDTKYWIVLENKTEKTFYVTTDTAGTYLNHYLATQNPGLDWNFNISEDFHFKVFEVASYSSIQTLFLYTDYSESSPNLWIRQLYGDESIYVRGQRIDELYGSGGIEEDNKVKVDVIGAPFSSKASGTFDVFVNDNGEVKVINQGSYFSENVDPNAVFKLWEVVWDTTDSTELFTGFTDIRKYRLIAEDDIRGMEIDDDGNATFTEDVTIEGTLAGNTNLVLASNIDMDGNDIINVGNESIKFKKIEGETDERKIVSTSFDKNGQVVNEGLKDASVSEVKLQDEIREIGFVSEIRMTAANTPPNEKWALCHGQAISREDYSELFILIGESYGSGDGSTTFNLPDFRGRTAYGAGDSGTTGSSSLSRGDTPGTAKQQLVIDQLPSHAHEIRGTQDGFTSGWNVPIQQKPSSDFTANSVAAGGDEAHENMSPGAVINYIIKVI